MARIVLELTQRAHSHTVDIHASLYLGPAGKPEFQDRDYASAIPLNGLTWQMAQNLISGCVDTLIKGARPEPPPMDRLPF